MAQTTSGLADGGVTVRFAISYESTLPEASGLDVARALMSVCDQDFDLMAGWFAGTEYNLNLPIPVQIQAGATGASWSSKGHDVTVLVNASGFAAPEAGVDFVRYLLVSEVTEQFMACKDNGWFDHRKDDEGSKGEGLSRFLGLQLALTQGFAGPYPDFEVVHTWLNTPDRPNYVDNDPDDNQPDVVTGCTTAFIFWLHDQLGYGITDIINAGAPTLGGVYQKLTGRTDGWQAFSDLVNLHYPTGTNYTTSGDDLFPVPSLRSIGSFTGRVTAGAGLQLFCSLDRATPADVHVSLVCADPDLLAVPATYEIGAGGMDGFVDILAGYLTGPEQTTTVTASYAGRTLTTAVTVEPRQSIITGTVLDPAGPLSGAVVVIDQVPTPSSVHMQLMTAGDGTFRTPVVPPGGYRIGASASDHVDATTTLTVTEGEPAVGVDLTLARVIPFVVAGTVTDQTGDPVAGASVILDSDDGYQLLATTDAGGGYRLPEGPGSFLGGCTLGASHPGYADTIVRVTITNGAALTENLTLPQLGSVTGTVTGGGATLAGATVQAGTAWVVTDGSGRYQLADLVPGPTAVTVSANGYEVAALTVAIPAGATLTEDVVLIPATARLIGTVWGPDQAPLTGATIQVAGTGAPVRSGTDGTYVVERVPAGHVLVTVRAFKLATQQSRLDVTAGQTLSVDWQLSAPGPIPPALAHAGGDGD